jgi:hypothetical protein
MSKEAVAPWLCLDIETKEGRPEDVIAWLRHHWWPQENLKPDTNLRKLEALTEDKKTKLALLDSAPLATVQLRTPESTLILHAFYAEEPRLLRNAAVMGFASEVELLIFLRDWLRRNCDEKTTIAGWNIKGFDLPRLRLMFLRAGLQLPDQLKVRADVYDMMKEYCRNFSVDRVEFMKLVVALEQMGIPTRKAEVNGSMVGAMIKEKRFEDVLEYGLDDINEETELFLRMTGQSAELK